MPDLFAHFASGYLISRIPQLRMYTALLVLGAILPDLLTRVPEIVLDRILGINIYHAVEIFHSPAVLCLVSFAFALMMARNLRLNAFCSLLFGSLVHVLLDIMQFQFGDSVYMPYFPFSFAKVQFALFHFNASIQLFPLIALLIFLVFLTSRGGLKNVR
jgi:hypothetical protein